MAAFAGISDDDLTLGTAYMSSYKPPTPPVVDMPQRTRPPELTMTMGQASYRSGSSMSGAGMGGTAGGTLSQEALEEKRRKALREREREIAAKQRQRELLAQRREMELKKRVEDEALRKLQETSRMEELQREDMEKERRREDNRQRAEEQQRAEEEERRRLAQIEKKREQTLRTIELQRLREEEAQRVKREVILKKRKEMERIRDQAERTFSEKKKDEMERKMWLVQEMKQKREQRLEELEQRRTNPLLLQQEREFNQLIELQASVGRLQTKLEGVQSKREDIRERLLEARHVVALLEVEERQVSIAVEEVEADLKKMRGYQEGLARLVSTRYDDDEYERAVVKIQTRWRGRKDWEQGKQLKRMKEHVARENAATVIQKHYRGRAYRRMAQDKRKVERAVDLQRVLRGRRARRAVRAARAAIAAAAAAHEATGLLQRAYRARLSRRRVAALAEEQLEKLRFQAEMAAKTRATGGVAKAPQPKGAPAARGAAAAPPRGRGAPPPRRAAEPPEPRGGGGGGGGGGAREGPRAAKPRAQGPAAPARKAAGPRGGGARRPSPRAGGVMGGELDRIYLGAPKARGGGEGGTTPRVRRFVPTAATAAVAADAAEVGGFHFVRDEVAGGKSHSPFGVALPPLDR